MTGACVDDAMVRSADTGRVRDVRGCVRVEGDEPSAPGTRLRAMANRSRSAAPLPLRLNSGPSGCAERRNEAIAPYRQQKCMAAGAAAVENTIRKQWIADFVASELCSTGVADAPVGRNRFIAPSGSAPPLHLSSGASGRAEWRNKAIAPYDSHYGSFNFVNPLICTVVSSGRSDEHRRAVRDPASEGKSEDGSVSRHDALFRLGSGGRGGRSIGGRRLPMDQTSCFRSAFGRRCRRRRHHRYTGQSLHVRGGRLLYGGRAGHRRVGTRFDGLCLCSRLAIFASALRRARSVVTLRVSASKSPSSIRLIYRKAWWSGLSGYPAQLGFGGVQSMP